MSKRRAMELEVQRRRIGKGFGERGEGWSRLGGAGDWRCCRTLAVEDAHRVAMR